MVRTKVKQPKETDLHVVLLISGDGTLMVASARDDVIITKLTQTGEHL